MTELLLYDVLKARILSGAALLKISSFCMDDGYYCVELPIENDSGIIYFCHPSISDKFINACRVAGVAVILFEEWVNARQEAYEKGRL